MTLQRILKYKMKKSVKDQRITKWNIINSYQSSILLRFQSDFIPLLTHSNVILNELSLINNLLYDETNDDRQYWQWKKHRCIATLIFNQIFRYQSIYRYPQSSCTYSIQLINAVNTCIFKKLQFNCRSLKNYQTYFHQPSQLECIY